MNEMDERRLVEMSRLGSRETPGRRRFCPDDEIIVEYFEGTLDERQRATLKRHLVDCGHCLARIGNLERLATQVAGLRLSGEVLAQAKSLAKPDSSRVSHSWSAWAAAAMILLAVTTSVMIVQWPGGNQYSPESANQTSPESLRQVRNAEPPAVKPGIISPLDGSIVDATGLTIRWTGIRGSLHYDIRVVDTQGFIIHSNRVEGDTEWTPPVSHLLEAGESYYIRVEAYLAEANSVSSDHVLFTVAESQP